MEKGKAFFVVGHSNWGKSKTLRALMKENRKRCIIIKKVEFFVRSMSNDDVPDSFIKFLKKLHPNRKPYVIATLCPKFDKRSTNTKKPSTEEMLRSLRKRYELFFFVLVHQWHGKGNGRIRDDETKKLRKFGDVKLYLTNNNRDNADVTKAREFKRYIESKLKH